jgi:hypothetical protein
MPSKMAAQVQNIEKELILKFCSFMQAISLNAITSNENLKLRSLKLQYQPYLEKLGNKLGGWKMPQSMGGRLTLVTSVLAAMAIFQLIALDQPVWFTKKGNKLICSFLWACKDEGKTSDNGRSLTGTRDE